MKTTLYYIFVVSMCLLINCSGFKVSLETQSDSETTGSGSSNVSDAMAMGSRMGVVADAIVPSINANSQVSSSSSYLTTGHEDAWDELLDDNNIYLITDIFGAADEEPGVVTKIRVMIDQFESEMEQLFELDPELSCEDGMLLNEGSVIDVAYYGTIDNGTEDDRYYKCAVTQDSDNGHYTTIYGQDASGVIRIAKMSDTQYDVEDEHVALRGTIARGLQVIMAVYAEVDGEDGATGYLDLQYTQATLYTGADEEYGTDDDVTFKSRTRITGVAILDEDHELVSSTGDFKVTKYDAGVNEDQSTWSSITKTAGRGSNDTGEHSLFRIDTSVTSITESDQTFCLENVALGLPTYAEAAFCEDLESSTPWDLLDFPFALDPVVESEFASKILFDEDDLIQNDGSNFEIPIYEGSAAEVVIDEE